MILAFELSMPGRNSWNGGWSGEKKRYVIVKSFRGKKREEKAAKILARGYYSYSWEDGWRAGIEVKQVDAKQAASLRRVSDGFCGYNWMVQTILDYGEPMAEPMADHEVREYLRTKKEASNVSL